MSCVIRFFESDVSDLQCMLCKQTWSPTFVYQAVPCKKWSKKMRDQRKAWLIQQQKAELVSAQETIPMVREVRRLTEETKTIRAEMKRLKKELEEKTTQKYQGIGEINEILYVDERIPVARGNEKQEPLVPCPITGCRGFLKGNECPVCQSQVCKRCLCEKTENHVCDEDVVKNVRLMRGSARPCPNCSAPSQKESGCSQVFCWSCKRSWDWNTGELVSQDVWQHSPDYYDYIRKTRGSVPRAPGDERGCVDNNPNTIVHEFFKIIENPKTIFATEDNKFQRWGSIQRSKPTDLGIFMREAHRFAGERCDTYQRRMFGVQMPDYTKDLRIRFLMGDIDEKRWQMELTKREKQNMLNESTRAWKATFREGFMAFAQNLTSITNPGSKTEEVTRLVDEFVGFCKMMYNEYRHLLDNFESKKENIMFSFMNKYLPAQYQDL